MFEEVLKDVDDESLKFLIDLALTEVCIVNDCLKERIDSNLVKILTSKSSSVLKRKKDGKHSEEYKKYSEIVDELSKIGMTVQGQTLFPNNSNRCFLNYLKSVIFENCKFKESDQENNFTKIFTGFSSSTRTTYSNYCEFFNPVEINVRIKNKVRSEKEAFEFYNDQFDDCIFHKSVIVKPHFDIFLNTPRPKKYDLTSLFYNCSFKSILKLKSLNVFCKISFFVKDESYIPALIVDDCVLEQSLKLNSSKNFKHKYRLICLMDSVFKDKFEMKGVECGRFVQRNCNFEKVCDFHGSIFTKRFIAKRSIYSDFFVFEKTQCLESGYKAIFQYVAFKSQSSFRDAKFLAGLDIEKANFLQPANFLGATVPLGNTPRETFRIIKHSFDSVGNFIEANHFFELEMRRHNKNLGCNPFSSEKFVFFINRSMSNFGQSYLFPIFWILVLAFISPFIYNDLEWYISCFLDVMLEADFQYTGESILFLNRLVCSIPPAQPFLKEGHEFFSLILNILFGALFWQTAVALKRRTKR